MYFLGIQIGPKRSPFLWDPCVHGVWSLGPGLANWLSPRSFWNLTDMVPVWFLFISPLMLLKEFIIHTNLFQKHPFIKIHVLNEIHWWSIWGLRCSKRFYGAIPHILLAPVQCCLWVGVAGSGCLVASFNEHFTMHLCTKQLIDRCAVWWRGRR